MTRYVLLITGASWLLAYQVVICIFSLANTYHAQLNPEFFDLMGYVSSLITAVICLFTISTAKQKHRQLKAERKQQTP